MQSKSFPTRKLKLGTRASPLAMVQAHLVRDKLVTTHDILPEKIEIVTMKTTGDQFTDRPLSTIGGKGLFTKELEIGLFNNDIDFAVHSMKDVATVLPDGLEISTVLEREDVRDAFVSLKYASIADLPMGARVGTSSLRRRAQLLRIRPDLEVSEFRGVVQTRLDKLRDGVADATFLAAAGLIRLGRDDLFADGTAVVIEDTEMLPAVAQAAIGIEIRSGEYGLRDFLSVLDHDATHQAINTERAMLRVLDGTCRTPIAAHATINDGEITLRGEVLSPDGVRVLSGEWRGGDALQLGQLAGLDLLDQGAADVLGG